MKTEKDPFLGPPDKTRQTSRSTTRFQNTAAEKNIMMRADMPKKNEVLKVKEEPSPKWNFTKVPKSIPNWNI